MMYVNNLKVILAVGFLCIGMMNSLLALVSAQENPMLEIFIEPPIRYENEKNFYTKEEACQLEDGLHYGVLDTIRPGKESIVFDFGKVENILSYFVNVYDLETESYPYEGYFFMYDCDTGESTSVTENIVTPQNIDSRQFFRYGLTAITKRVYDDGSILVNHFVPSGIGAPGLTEYFITPQGGVYTSPYFSSMTPEQKSTVLNDVGSRWGFDECFFTGEQQGIGGHEISCLLDGETKKYYMNCSFDPSLWESYSWRTEDIVLFCSASLCESAFDFGGGSCDQGEQESDVSSIVVFDFISNSLISVRNLSYGYQEFSSLLASLVKKVEEMDKKKSVLSKVNKLLLQYESNKFIYYVLKVLREKLSD